MVFAELLIPSFPLCSRAEGSISELFFVNLARKCLVCGREARNDIRKELFATDRISSLSLSKGGLVGRCKSGWYSLRDIFYQLQFPLASVGGRLVNVGVADIRKSSSFTSQPGSRFWHFAEGANPMPKFTTGSKFPQLRLGRSGKENWDDIRTFYGDEMRNDTRGANLSPHHGAHGFGFTGTRAPLFPDFMKMKFEKGEGIDVDIRCRSFSLISLPALCGEGPILELFFVNLARKCLVCGEMKRWYSQKAIYHRQNFPVQTGLSW